MTVRRVLPLLPQRFAICRFAPDTPLPVWVLHSSPSVWSITRTPTELLDEIEARGRDVDAAIARLRALLQAEPEA